MSRKHIPAFLLFLFIAAFLGAGCKGKAAVKPSDEAVAATQALGMLQEMKASYESHDAAGFMRHVSQGYKPGYAGLADAVKKDIEGSEKVSLELTVDRVELEGDSVRLAAHWYGNWRLAGGKGREGRGNAVFAFGPAGPNMALGDVTGDSPFGTL